MLKKVPILMQDPDDPQQWILVKQFEYAGGFIPKGFVFDFASIPRVFWIIIAPSELGDVAPLVHDWCYRNGRGTRKEVDKVFLKDMIEDNIIFWKRWLAYNLVRTCGWQSWNSGKVIIKDLSCYDITIADITVLKQGEDIEKSTFKDIVNV